MFGRKKDENNRLEIHINVITSATAEEQHSKLNDQLLPILRENKTRNIHFLAVNRLTKINVDLILTRIRCASSRLLLILVRI